VHQLTLSSLTVKAENGSNYYATQVQGMAPSILVNPTLIAKITVKTTCVDERARLQSSLLDLPHHN
jgi:hypothetical protein